eukprot:sb/3467164/
MIGQLIRHTKVFSCSSHPSLATSIATSLSCPLVPVNLGTFSNGETKIAPLSSVGHGEHCIVVQSAQTNDQLMETLLTIQACKQVPGTFVSAVLPWLPYTRSDKTEGRNYPIGSRLVCNMLEGAGADHVVTVDLHSPQIEGFFSIPFSHLQTTSLLADELRGRDVVLVSPDAGAMKKVSALSELTGLPFALIHKERCPDNGKISRMTLVGDVRGRGAVIVDDMADTCGTILKAAQLLVNQGGAASVEAILTHGILSGGAVAAIEGEDCLSAMCVSNSLSQTSNMTRCRKLSTFDITDLILQELTKFPC